MKFVFTTAMLFGIVFALPAELARENNNQGAHKATVEAANSYTEFGWVGNGKRDTQGFQKP
ncbi:uncharacterized protein BDV17DRAFT_291880 [Aspergillus undulatus]|uniref:uncharacterized protein n=1 Tax=Aspergillus undulatus TaxID=1810928 RepID=UPI003CCE0EE8